MLNRHILFVIITLVLAALACSTVAPPRPALEWDESPDAVIIEAYYSGGMAPQNWVLNAIPVARVYGDGRIVWVGTRINTRERHVYEGTLTREQMLGLLTQFSDAGFFGWQSLYGPVDTVYDAGTTTLRVNLVSESKSVSEYFEGAPAKFHDLVSAVGGGAGATGAEFVPATGYLTAMPAGDGTRPSDFRWPDDEAGFTLAEAVGGRTIEGETLALAWSIINTNIYALVESGGQQYQLTLQVPRLSQIEPPAP
jgi:hypothetical protein